MSRLAIFGAGGFGREVITVARADRRELVLVADERAPDFDGIPVLSFDQLRDDDEMVIAIGDPAVRRRIAARWHRFTSVFAPSFVMGRRVEVGEGAIFCDFSMVTSSARIGRHFHCNTFSGVAHDCVIGDFVTFAGSVRCNGNVHVGDGAYIGPGAVLRSGSARRPLLIGEGAVVGMGAVVTRNVPPHTTVFGNPATALPRPAGRAGADQSHAH